MSSDIEAITASVKKFRDDRDWKQFHDPKNLAISLNIESAELLQNFLWKEPEDASVAEIQDELADVFYNAFLLAEHYGLDVKAIVMAKLQKNAEKYPIDKAKGNNKKYNNL